MKLLVISNMYPSEKDPVYGTFVQSFVENMSELNKDGSTDIIVVRGRDGNRFQKLWKYIKFYFTTLYILLFCKYDVVYVHTITYPIVPIRIASIFKKLPLVFNVHGGDVLTRGTIAAELKKMAIPLLKKSKLIVSPSCFFKGILIREFPFLTTEKIFVSSSSGIDKSFFGNEKFKINDVFTIGYVSRISSAKGWDTLLESFSAIVKTINCKLIVAGRGTQVKEFQMMIQNKGLSKYVKYLGPVPYKRLPEIYRNLDLFVFPTCLEESLGLVGIEAMASGVPVIGSKIGGLTDYIIDGYNGYYFLPGNSESLATQILKYYYLDEQKKTELERGAFLTAKKYESEEINKDLYNELLKRFMYS